MGVDIVVFVGKNVVGTCCGHALEGGGRKGVIDGG